MDAERRTEIRRWAEGLERSEAAELRAAGRALTMLVEENEELARRLERVERRPPSPPPAPYDAETPEELSATEDRSRPERRRRRPPAKGFPWRLLGVVAGAVLVAGVIATLAMAAVRPDLEAGGVRDGAVVGRAALPGVRFWAGGEGIERAEWRLDGARVSPKREGDR